MTRTWTRLQSAHSPWSLVCLQGMSEEAVRQTRSQKRALERDALPQSTQPSASDSESKKPKLDPSEPATDAQTKPERQPAESGSDLSRTTDTPKHEKDGAHHHRHRDGDAVEEDEEARGQSPPAAWPDEEELTQRWQTSEPSSDGRADCDQSVNHVEAELGADAKSRPPATEAGGEAEAGVKAELQAGEQPVDMSTSRR